MYQLSLDPGLYFLFVDWLFIRMPSLIVFPSLHHHSSSSVLFFTLLSFQILRIIPSSCPSPLSYSITHSTVIKKQTTQKHALVIGSILIYMTTLLIYCIHSSNP